MWKSADIFYRKRDGKEVGFMTIAERIAALPTAVNTAAEFNGKLTQGAPSASVEKSKANAQTTKASVLSSLYAFDRADYTKEDALKKQWRKMNTVNLVDILDGTADRSNRSLSIQDLERRLQEGTATPSVDDTDMQMLEFEFKGLGFDAGPAYADVGAEKVSRNIEYLASRYAAMESKIKETYSGALQKAELDKLDQIYQRAVTRTADKYAEIVGGILEKNEVSGEKEKLSKAYIESVEARTAQYREFLKGNQDFTGVEGTENAWLAKDDEYVAARLREQNIAFQAAPAENGGYTRRDLEILGQYASEITVMEAKANTYDMNEERMGLEFAMLAMKTDTIEQEGGVSEELKETLEKTLDGFMESFMDRFDQQLSTNRDEAMTAYDSRGNTDLDKESVWNVYNKTMDEYRQSGDLMKALVKGAEYAKDRYDQKEAEGSVLGVYRYMNGASYWNNFFKANTGGGYDRTASTYSRHLTAFMDFKKRLDSGVGLQMNLTGSVNYYSANIGGELISEEA